MAASPKNLLFLSASPGLAVPGSYGGGEHFAVEFLTEMARRGWVMALACPPASPLGSHPLLQGQGLLRRIFPIDLTAKISAPVHFAAVLLQWRELVRSDNAPLLYGNAFETLKWLAAARCFRKVKTVCHLHESEYSHYASRRARWLSPGIDRFLAISDTVRNAYLAGSGIAPGRVEVIPNGIPFRDDPLDNAAARAELGIAPAAPWILMAGRTDPLKGQAVLLRAAPQILARHPDTRFSVIGVSRIGAEETRLGTEWDRIIEEAGIGHAVSLLPYRADVRRLMHAADIVAVPSISEGFGRTAIEAMAEGTALVASRVGGLAEIITDGENGLLSPPDDPAALAGAILRLLDDPGLRCRLALAGRETVNRKYSISVMTNRIEGELLRVLEEPGDPPGQTQA